MPAPLPAPPSAADWLRRRDEAQLVRLLQRRPDLAVPVPGDLEVLGRRLDTPTSVHRVLEGADAVTIAVLSALSVLEAHRSPVTVQALLELFPADRHEEVRDRLVELEELAAARSTPDGRLSIPGSIADALGPYPFGLGHPGPLDAAAVRRELAELDERELGLLRRLDAGPPRGTFSADSPTGPVVTQLLSRGLLTRIDRSTVELPRQVGLLLRGELPLGDLPRRPPAASGHHTPDVVDRTAAGQALTVLQELAALLRELDHQPATTLKSGGVGVRELRRLARTTEGSEHRAALLLELAAAGGLLVAADGGRPGRAAGWQPTVAADTFGELPEEQAWASLAGWWLDLRRDPARAGERDDAQKVLAPLTPELSWVRGPTDRRFVLGILAALPPGTGPTEPELAAELAWRAPLRSPARRDALATATITEATWLGLVAFGALSTAGRSLLDGDAEGAAGALALPAPVDQVLIQADLTVVAPGRLDPQLRRDLDAVADVESAGSATVYRVTPASLRRALTAGRTADDLHELFARASATPVPQGLDYLIDDTARRHGVLRAGTAAGYLRSDDPALIAEAVSAATAAGIAVRRLAPTVVVCDVEVADLLAVLAEAQLSAVAEDAAGAVLRAVSSRPRRAAPRVAPPPVREAGPPESQLVALVRRMQVGDRSRPGPEQTPGESIAVLRRAAHEQRSVWIGYVDAEGGTSRRLVKPVVVSGGMMVAHDSLRSSMRTFALHRVTEAQLDDD